MSEYKIPEIEGREPDTVTYAQDGRRIEIYGKPSVEACAEALFRIIKKRTEEAAKNV
ncbi:MAG: hypothetical protein ACI4SF_00620 [Oscillospiraceae bacterium]